MSHANAPSTSRTIHAIVVDVGETLVDETAEYGAWADWLGVPRHTFSAVFGAAIALGRDHREVFEHFRPGFDLETETRRREDAGVPLGFGEVHLYPDARPALTALRDAGYAVVIAANQPARAHRILDTLRLPVDLVTTSAGWGVAKPDPAFFARIIETCQGLRPGGLRPHQICYVGDRLDNDMRPARAAGLRTAFIRRGPWGHIAAGHPDLAKVDFQLERLTDLPDLLTEA